MSLHVLYLSDYSITSVNVLLGSHWSKRRRVKRAEADLIGLEVLRQRIPQATGRRRVTLHVALAKGQRAMDEDNIWKSLLDALVQCHRLIDDRPKWCERGGTVWLRSGTAFRAVYVLLEDC